MKLIALAQSHREKAASLEAPESKRVFPALVRHAEFALRAGARLSWDDYLALDPLERLAFVRAGDLLRVREAQRVGIAGNGVLGAAAAASDVDGGAALELLALEAMHASALEEAGHGIP